MTVDDWVKKLNALAREMDERADSVHPSAVSEITADLRKKYKALAQSDKVTPNQQLSGASASA